MKSFVISKSVLKRTVSAVAIATSLLAVGAMVAPGTQFDLMAYAADDGTSTNGPDNGQGNQGGQGAGQKGAQAGQDNQGGGGSGQGGPDSSSDGVGPQAGTPSDSGSGGGKPAWAQEGIPEVELGRLSVARSPDQVLDRSLEEAIANVTPELLAFYNQSLTDMIVDLSLNFDTISIYDSPLQSLALFQDILEDGDSQLPGLNDSDDGKLLAVFLGIASDKTITITSETVVAILTILGDDLPSTISVDVDQVAADAEAIRIAVLAGHG